MSKPNADRPSRRAALVLAAAGLAAAPLAACDGGERDAQALASDNILGDPDAPVKVIEYASVMCPHCKAFHDEVYPEFKARYIDTGKVCFVFREMPTAPGPLSMAGFLTARCASNDKYFDVLDVLFEHQVDLYQAYQSGGGAARDRLLAIAHAAGVTEDQFDACIRDQLEIERIQRIDDEAQREHGIHLTPSFLINDQVYDGAYTLEGLAAVIDPLLAVTP